MSEDKELPVSKEEGQPSPRNQRRPYQPKRKFNFRQKQQCWEKAEEVKGRDPDRWRRDIAGNVLARRLTGCDGCLCYEFDHVVPWAKDGPTSVENCQILQTRANRWKSDRTDVQKEDLRKASCDLVLSERELDLIELSLWGDVKRKGRHFRARTVGEEQELANNEDDQLPTKK
jgi:hypothetical protein